MFTLNCRGKLLRFTSPIVMGIINITPDSFYTGSRKKNIEEALQKARQMIEEGASIIDIGGQSTRPGSEQIGAALEAERVLPVIEALHKEFAGIVISTDTYHASVAKQSVLAGAGMINDISGGHYDKEMLAEVAKLGVPYICMHMKGTPVTMQQNPFYKNVTRDVFDYFTERTNAIRNSGIKDLIIDPGFGFGKNIAHNFELLRNLSIFKMFKKPVLLGISRKSTIYKTLGVSAEEALNGTTVLHTLGLANGAVILRVHDVKEAIQTIKLFDEYRKKNSIEA